MRVNKNVPTQRGVHLLLQTRVQQSFFVWGRRLPVFLENAAAKRSATGN